MKYTFFEIANFKGIEKLRISLNQKPQQNVYTLVGLNESGKTTILEAINFFTHKKENLEPLNLQGYSIKNIHDIIPISKRDNFNDEVSIIVGLSLDEADEEKIKEFVKEKFNFHISERISDIRFIQRYPFKNSSHDNKNAIYKWQCDIYGTQGKGRVVKKIGDKELLEVNAFIKTMMPSIVYFPNFLFEFPDKIYLEPSSSTDKKYEFYKAIIQDILDSLENDLTIQEHIVDRFKSSDKSDRRNLDSVLLKMGSRVTQIVFQAWNQIFNNKINDNKRILIRCDEDDDGRVYLEFILQDDNNNYLINERSLGFRWFFVFFLFTQFRGFRKSWSKNALFLFDEPASNLHSTAQTQLLNSFAKLPQVIYTTHSHYMINPQGLEGTYIVKNMGLDYNDEDNYHAKMTKIAVEPYRQFVIKHPKQIDYFKPILDVLDYAPSNLEFMPDVVILEGKNDFYTLNYMLHVLKHKKKLHFLPNTSASNLASIISMYFAWGKDFIILLDADKEGKSQKKRYIKYFGPLLENKIYTLADINSAWDNYTLEDIFDNNDKTVVQNTIYPSSAYKKEHFNRAIQELLITKNLLSFSKNSVDNFSAIFDFLGTKI